MYSCSPIRRQLADLVARLLDVMVAASLLVLRAHHIMKECVREASGGARHIDLAVKQWRHTSA
jgi:hypothetical protein